MSKTTNYDLYITDDAEARFQDFRREMCGLDNSNMVKIDTILKNKADSCETIEAVLTASGWTGSNAPFTQTVDIDSLTAEQDGDASVSATATYEQREASREAILHVAGQVDGSLIIAADGVKPAVDIPITIILLH